MKMEFVISVRELNLKHKGESKMSIEEIESALQAFCVANWGIEGPKRSIQGVATSIYRKTEARELIRTLAHKLRGIGYLKETATRMLLEEWNK